MKTIISSEKQKILDKLDRAKHLAHREEILTLIQYKKGKIKKIKGVEVNPIDIDKSIEDLEIEADLDLAEADYVETENNLQKKERELLDSIELALDEGNLTKASELFERFLDFSYNTVARINSKHMPKCTTMWAIRHYLSLSVGEPSRSELLGQRLLKLHEKVFTGGRIDRRRAIFDEKEESLLSGVFKEFVDITNGTIDDFVDFVTKSVEDLDFHSPYSKNMCNQ